MGVWGVGLYDNDIASDLRDEISLISKIPLPGDQLLDILLVKNPHADDLSDWEACQFWLITADQFYRKGIVSEKVMTQVNLILGQGLDQQALKDQGLPERDLKKRQQVTDKLSLKLTTPKLSRKIPINPIPPKLPVSAGEVYAFPAMEAYLGYKTLACGFSAHYKSWDAPNPYKQVFEPNCWGALLILSTGHLYGWLPWAAYLPISVPLASKATIKDVLQAYLMISSIQDYAYICNPSALHLKRMEAQKIAEVLIDEQLIKDLLPPENEFTQQILIDASVSNQAFNLLNKPEKPFKVKLADILVKSA